MSTNIWLKIDSGLKKIGHALFPSRINRMQAFTRHSFSFMLLGILALSIEALKDITTSKTVNVFDLFHLLLYCSLWILAFMLFIYKFFVLPIQRLHDRNSSGWWTLVCFIPILNFIIALVLIFGAGTKGKNRFGPQPKTSKADYILMAVMLLAILAIFINSSMILKYLKTEKVAVETQTQT